ncbi:MAG TPA: hypothetical protein VFN35_07855 [Ktedonobacteraceae bacterium]|nr:hypothetical protein [Ktedonobacteraceae bacterium]
MTILIQSRRASLERIQQQHPEAVIFDVTSRGPEPWLRFSPFYPHGNIPVPFSPGLVSASVEGIWQGLKVFEQADVDTSRFAVTSMKNLKRSVRTYGNVLGHRQGVNGDQLLSYAEARKTIYLPVYLWVLTNCLQDLLTRLRNQQQTVILLDYETNCDLSDLTRPLSHAGLIKRYLEEQWPSEVASEKA